MNTSFQIHQKSHSIGEKRESAVGSRTIIAGTLILLVLATGIHSFTKTNPNPASTNPSPVMGASLPLPESGQAELHPDQGFEFNVSTELPEFSQEGQSTDRWATLDLNKPISLGGSSMIREWETGRQYAQ